VADKQMLDFMMVAEMYTADFVQEELRSIIKNQRIIPDPFVLCQLHRHSGIHKQPIHYADVLTHPS